MAIRDVGPGKTYATIALAAAAASDGDTIECFFDSIDTSFLYQPPAVTIKAATGFSPKWLRSSYLTTCIRAMIVDGLEIGKTDNSSGGFFNAPSYSAAGFGVILRNCSFSFGTGTPSVMSADVQAAGNVPMSLTVENCTMAQTTNRLGALLSISGASATQLCKGTLRVINSTLRTAGLRQVSANGLFVEQRVERSIIQIATAAGSSSDFDTGSTSTLYQSVLDGLGTATALMSADCAKTTVDVKSSYLMRAVGDAVALTNCPASDLFVNTAFIDNATSAISAAHTVTEHCLFDGNTNDYIDGGALDATDITGTVTYTDLAGGDYAPTDLSDTIDAGIDVGFVTDIRGEAIPQGSDFDIGPYEFPEVTIVKLLTATATASDTVVITADGDLTAAIANIADWTVTADNPGVADMVISSITIGAPTTEATIVFTADMTPREDYTITSIAAKVDPLFNTLQYSALSVGARMVQAIFVDSIKQIIVTVDKTVTQGGTGALAHWSQTLHSTFGDTITLTDVDVQGGSGVTIGLTYTGRPTPGARYQIVTDSAEFETGYKTVYAVMVIGAQDFTPEPLLPSLLSGVGKQLAYVVGNPQTVLTTALTPGDTVAYVESTLGFPDTNGVVYIGGTRLDYTAKTSYSFTGVVWPFVTIPGSPTTYRTNFNVFQIDTPVTDYSHEYCLEDAATNERIISRCTGSQLKRLVSSLGFTPPLATMLDTDIQDYANERMYQDTGTWQSIFRTLRPVLRELEPNGTAVVGAGPILDEVLITDSVQAAMLVGRWMEVNGKIARIASVTAGTGANCYDITFCDYDGLMWEDPDLASQIGTTVEWRLLLFTMYCDLTVMSRFPRAPGSLLNVQAGRWVVNLYTGGQVALTMPVGYWCADATFDMNGESALRPRHNYLAASHATIAVTNDRFLYLIDNYDYEVTALTGELVPAAVIPIVDVL